MPFALTHKMSLRLILSLRSRLRAKVASRPHRRLLLPQGLQRRLRARRAESVVMTAKMKREEEDAEEEEEDEDEEDDE